MRVSEMEKMSLEQLKAVKEQADLEVNLLQDSLNNVRSATSRLELASSALQDLSLRPQGLHSLSIASFLFSPIFLL
jgi:prefoldin alpha subunit